MTMDTSKIGPNSIIQTVKALREAQGEEKVHKLLHNAELEKYLQILPSEMVDEEEFIRLVHALVELCGYDVAKKVLRTSGQYTGTYLLENRIPRVAQWLFGVVPKSVGMNLFLKAIGKNAWTFVGSGSFTYQVQGNESYIKIENSINSRGLRAEEPLCAFYTGTFEKLFQTLIDRKLQVNESKCIACGDNFCYFEVK
ncbi:bacteriochlorophyll 4-vinyl reductase [Heliorestis convoluta]|uniref:Bacteriochlorophyll 4-vinyl reductase n=1 Tax=Heliorestis convoluta TaxID=356322 RepID=A0A5Q2N4B6_9FIRM|nr:bacteriochlorophyll 4-vinyl reductase [Heliorestis convoluta]QGG48729.1 bacteriochlorophyll 4-vinyl reductase [Heliorestis convoluta]